MRAPVRRLALATALALTATPAAGQVVTHVVPEHAERGWVGVSITVQTTQDGAGTQTSTTVTGVSIGSPAYEAGILAGDVLVSVNGSPWLPRDLRPGDTVRMVLRRGGARRVVTLTAAPRPADVDEAPTLTVTLRDDAMADRMFLAMDSVRARLATDVRQGSRLVEIGDVRLPGAEVTSLGVWTPSELRPPFAFYLFRGEAHDSLTRAMEELNGDIRRLRSEQAARVRELARDLPGNESRIDRNDPELQRLQLSLVDLDRRASALREAMERAAQRSPGDAYVGAFSGVADRTAADPLEREARFRPLDVYLLGQNRAAGAEVVDLRPELAEYFGVEGGVLVVDVAEGTPAALAGIQPGDVLTHIGRLPVLSIQELRKGLAGTGAEIPVTVVRKGHQIQLLLVR